MHVAARHQEVLQVLVAPVLPRMVEADASGDDQDGGEDGVVERSESFGLSCHDADVRRHCKVSERILVD